jgi:hypothetical protein
MVLGFTNTPFACGTIKYFRLNLNSKCIYWCADVPLNIGVDDSDDWLHRYDSYTRNIRISSKTPMANPNTSEKGITNWLTAHASCIPYDLFM